MQPINHQLMGYDRAITMFSPDGRLLQVEYAKKTVKQGSTAIGIMCTDGVLLVTDKRLVDPLIVPEAIEKIFQIDAHIAATFAGISSDARVLIERAQLKSQQHRVTYDAPVEVISVVKTMCDLMQLCTQSGGLRPFGVSVLIAGKDAAGLKLFQTDPTGIYFQYKATVIGEGEEQIEEILHKEYKDSLTWEQGLAIAIRAMKEVLGDQFKTERIDAALVSADNGLFTRVDQKVIDRVAKTK